MSILLGNKDGFSQDSLILNCNVQYTPDPPGLPFLKCQDTLNDPIFFRLYLYSFSDSIGTDEIPEQEFTEIIRQLNKEFSPRNIHFQREYNPEFVRNSSIFNQNGPGLFFDYTENDYIINDGISIYSFAKGGLNNFGQSFTGLAAGIGSNFSFLFDEDSDEFFKKLFLHELGHNLGLFHTFQNGILTKKDTIIFVGELPEFGVSIQPDPVCFLYQDYICDTKTDAGWTAIPQVFDKTTCEMKTDLLPIYIDDFESNNLLVDGGQNEIPWNHGELGNYYCNPDVSSSNYMGYNWAQCKHEYSPQQFQRMRCMAKSYNPVIESTIGHFPTEITTTMSYESETRAETWIIIKSGGKLTIESDLYMPYWGAIIVEPGGELVLEGGHIKPYADGDFWQGIEVLGTGGNTGNGKFTGTSGTIERARIAVHAENGGRVNLEGIDFINNKAGVSIKNSRHLALPSYINNCNFTTDGVLHDLAWHVPLWNGGTLELEGEQNEYHDHTFFVRLENVNKMGIKGNKFITVQAPGVDHNGMGIILIDSDVSISSGNYFKNQKIGIVKLNWQNGAHGITTIKGNIFEDNFRSIGLAKGDLSNITGNEIVVPDIELGGQKAVGIYIQNSSGVSIKDLNIFEVSGVEDAEDAQEAVFIYAINTGSTRSSDIQRNDFGSKGAPKRHIELQGTHPRLQIACNPFVQSAGTDFAVGLESGASLAHQGSTLNPAGNDWYHPSTCTGAVELYKHSGASGYTYHSFNNDAPSCFSHGIVISPDLFTSKPNTYCDMPDPCPGPMIDCVLTEVEIIRDDKDDITNNPPWYLSLDQISKVVDHLDWKLDLVVQEGIYHYMETDSIDMLITMLDSMIVRDTAWSSVQALIADRYEEAPMRPGIELTAVYSGSQSIQKHYKSNPGQEFHYTPLVMESEQENIVFDVHIVAQHVPVNLFPNPANNEIQIPVEWTSTLGNSLSGRILDLTGRSVKQIEMQNTGSAIILDVNQLSEGFFLLQLSDQSGTSFTGKFFIKR